MIKLSIGKKILLITTGTFAGILLVAYLVLSAFYNNHFYYGTWIGELNCGGKDPEAVKQLIRENASRYTLLINGREGMQGQIRAEDIGLEYQFDGTLEKIAEEQNGFAWISAFWNQPQYQMPIMISYEEDLLQQRLDGMLMFQPENMKPPCNAKISEYNIISNCYEILEEYPGTTLIRKKAEEAVRTALSQLQEELSLEESSCYKRPSVTKEDSALNQFCRKLNKYVSTQVRYNWNGGEEVIDGDQVSGWLDIDFDNYSVEINTERVRKYVDNLSKIHDTYGKARLFQTTTGEEVVIKGGNYGWRADREGETEALLRIVRAGLQIDREPIYLFEANVKGRDDIGGSYVEIDLTNQHLYLYVDGELITESDFVSGNLARGFGTPDGVYGLTYKTRDAILRGQNYETPVKYWMPFNGNIGMHDASWRRKFGGDIYKTSGSHGCINLPPEAAETIYEYVYKGFPVVCYFGSEWEEEGNEEIKEDVENRESD